MTACGTTVLLFAGGFASVDGMQTTASPDLRDSILKKAQELAAKPILKRVFRVDDLPQDCRWASMLERLKGNRYEFFGLAMADSFMTRRLAEELPLLAVGAVLNGEAALRQRVLDQLAEMATWHPLNRPGWTLYTPGEDVPSNFNDGNWLGTGQGIRAIVTTLEVLGDQTPAELRARTKELLAKEIMGVRDDFNARRPWYWDTPVSNQFVLPNTGVVLACAALGKGPGDEDYEFGVRNLLCALDAQGADGSHHEGSGYGSFTDKEILYAALALMGAGDRRLMEHPHLKNVGHWLTHLVQPGHHAVNFFDAGHRRVGKVGAVMLNPDILDALMLCALGYDQPGFHWIIAHELSGPPASALGWKYQQCVKDASSAPPQLSGSFSGSPLVTWRSSWDEDAVGVWVRGGSPEDSHDHRDHGHVNYIVGGREVLIEAGSTDYAYPDYHKLLSPGIGHNVLQVGEDAAGAQIKGRGAPIAVKKLDETGGDVMVDATGDYDPKVLAGWQRRVIWDATELKIEDQVALPLEKPSVPLFRFHLAEGLEVQIAPVKDGRTVQVSWLDGEAQFEGDAELTVETTRLPHGITWTEKAEHTCLVVKPRRPVPFLRLTTTVRQRSKVEKFAERPSTKS